MRTAARAADVGPSGIVAYLIGNEPPAADWLEQMEVVAVDENGTWKLTARGGGGPACREGECHQVLRPAPDRRRPG
jgi:hypothetical protein